MAPEHFQEDLDTDTERSTVTVVTKTPMAEVQGGEFQLVEEGAGYEIPLEEIRGEDLQRWIDEQMPHSD